jgi:hypothetical protein
MPFAQFACLLSRQEFFIPKVTLLNDHWEGVIHWRDEYLQEKNEAKLFNACRQRQIELGVSPSDLEEPFEIPTRIDESSFRWVKEWMYVSCWHKGTVESQAMWKLYGGYEPSVAIQINASKLVSAYEEHKKNVALNTIAALWEVIYIPPGTGDSRRSRPKVLYTDENVLTEFKSNPAYTFTFEQLPQKHIGYAYENEVRFAIGESLDEHKINKPNQELGISLPIKADFADMIYVSPGAPDWFFDTVRAMVEKYGFNATVNRSSLDIC